MMYNNNEIEWQRTGPGRWVFEHIDGRLKYNFVRKGAEGSYKYELWINGQLADNTLDKYGVMRVLRDGYRKAGGL